MYIYIYMFLFLPSQDILLPSLPHARRPVALFLPSRPSFAGGRFLTHPQDLLLVLRSEKQKGPGSDGRI